MIDVLVLELTSIVCVIAGWVLPGFVVLRWLRVLSSASPTRP